MNSVLTDGSFLHYLHYDVSTAIEVCPGDDGGERVQRGLPLVHIALRSLPHHDVWQLPLERDALEHYDDNYEKDI